MLDAPGGPVELHNFYVPAGGDIPDREANPKFGHKLDFVAEATRWFDARGAKRNLRGPGGEFLTQRDGRCILHVCAANFHDGRKIVRLGRQRIAQRLKGGKQMVFNLQHTGDMHRRGE